MKPNNFLIGSTRDRKTRSEPFDYPSIRMTDFGLANVKSPNRGRPRLASLYRTGTPRYLAPEQENYSTYWPNGDLYGIRARNFQFSEVLNTYGIGRTMYAMMSLGKLP